MKHFYLYLKAVALLPGYLQCTTGFRLCLLILTLLTLSLTTEAQTRRYVKPTASGNGSGDSWSNASSDLQAMINASSSGQQVWVAAGTYKPTITTGTASRTISFAMKDGVAIYGGFMGGETNISQRLSSNPVTGLPSSSTLSGNIGSQSFDNDNSYHVISNKDLTNTAILDGFVITGGRPVGFGLTGNSVGGGLYNLNSSPTLTNCLFQDNWSTQSSGGALANETSNPVITNCLFATNRGGTDSFGNGGAVYNTGSSPILINCSFQGNTAYERGGAMFSASNSNPTLINCSFLNNSKISSFGGGGAIASENSSANLINCSFQNNSSASNLGGLTYSTGSGTLAFTNSVIFDNGGAAAIYKANTSAVSAMYSLFDASVTGYTDLGNNITTDLTPFANTTSTQLNGCASAINMGNNAAYTSVNGPTTDLVGNSRRYNNGLIDMGANEYQAAPLSINVTNPFVTSATLGMAFSRNFTAISGTAPYSFTVAGGSLPDGLNLSTTGVLSGTPTESGSFTITVRATDANGCSGVGANYILTIPDNTPTITGFGAVNTSVCVGSLLTFTATVGNVSGLYNYTLTNGIGTPTSGVKTGTAFTQNLISSESGSQSFTLIVRANGQSKSATTDVTVSSLPVPSLTNNGPISCTLPAVTLTASGGNSYTFTKSGEVIGTPGSTNTVDVTTAGTYTVRMVNVTGCVSTTTTTVTNIAATVPVSNPATRNGVVNVAFSQTFSASGGTSPRSFSVASGTLPDGLSLSTTGVLSGTPTESGSFTITVQATDANGCSGVGASYVLTIIDNTPIISDFGAVNTSVCVGSIATFTATIGNVTGAYNYTLTNGIGTPTSGVKNSAAFSQNLTLAGSGTQSFTLTIRANNQSTSATIDITAIPFPVASLTNNGPLSCTMTTVTLTASGGTSYTFIKSGEVVGTPGSTNTIDVATLGTYTVRVANATGCVSTTTTTVGNIVATVNVNNPSTTNGVQNVAFSQNFTASGGTAPRSFSVVSGSLPTGLNLSTTGVLSGTPTQSGSFPITVRATDVNGCSSVGAAYVLTIVNNTPIIDNFAAVNNAVCVGSPVTFTATISNVTGTYSYTLTNGINTPTTGTKTGAAFSQNLTSTGSGSQSFTLIISDNNQSAFATTDVTVNSLPTPALTNNGPISCTLPAVTLTASGGNSYTFTTSGGIVVGTPGAANTVDVTASGTYTVRVANATGCISTTTTTVTGTLPTITVTNPATRSGIANVAFSQNFTASGGTAPRSFSVVSGRLPDGLSLASTGNLSGIPAEGGSFTIAVGATDANGCSGVGAAYVLTITDNTPTIADFAAVNSSVCVGSTVTFTATIGNVSGSYSYTLTNGSGTPSIGTKSSAAFSQNITSAGSGSQSFTLIIRDNNQSSSATTNVMVSSFPVPSLTNNGPISCTLPAVTLTASGGNSYTFTRGGTVVGSSGSANTLDVTVAGTYTVRVANESGCASTTTTTVTSNTVIPTLTVSPTSATLTIARPSTNLTASGTGSFLWSTGETSPMISVTTSGNYSVTLTGANGCSATANVPVRGSDLTANILLPQAQFGASGAAAVGNFVVNVFEVGGLPTSSGNVTITITVPIGYTVAFPANLTSIDVQTSGTVSVNNGQWTVTQNLTNRQLTLTMNSGAFISGGGESSLGFTLTRTSANSGSTASITVNVADDLTMTYDGNLANNVYARIISGL